MHIMSIYSLKVIFSTTSEIVQRLRGTVIISCQRSNGDLMRSIDYQSPLLVVNFSYLAHR